MSFLFLTGRIGQDAELRSTQGGTKVVSFSVADDVGFGDKKTTQWIKCALFGERAEKLAKYLTKGTSVEVMGNPSINSYEGKNGHKAELQCRVIEVKLMGGGKRDDAPVADKGRATAPQNDDVNDDIPF